MTDPRPHVQARGAAPRGPAADPLDRVRREFREHLDQLQGAIKRWERLSAAHVPHSGQLTADVEPTLCHEAVVRARMLKVVHPVEDRGGTAWGAFGFIGIPPARRLSHRVLRWFRPPVQARSREALLK
jgi:hypothetical protein